MMSVRRSTFLVFSLAFLFMIFLSGRFPQIECQDCYKIWADKQDYCVGEQVAIHWEDKCPYILIIPPVGPDYYRLSLMNPDGTSQTLVQHGTAEGTITTVAGYPVGQRTVTLETIDESTSGGGIASSIQMVNQTTYNVIDCGGGATLGPPPTLIWSQDSALRITSNVGDYDVFLNGVHAGKGTSSGVAVLGLAPGNYSIVLEKAGCQPATGQANVATGVLSDVTIPMICQPQSLTPVTMAPPTYPPTLPPTLQPTLPPTLPPTPVQLISPSGGFSLNGNTLLYAMLGIIALLLIILIVVMMSRGKRPPRIYTSR